MRKFDRSILISCLLFLGMATPIVWFADQPPYRLHAPGETELRLVVRHSGVLVGKCTEISSDDLADLAPNMRKPTLCPREKSPLSIRLSLDGETRYQETLYPSGIHRDGVIAQFRKFPLTTRPVNITVDVKADALQADFDRLLERNVTPTTESVIIVELNDAGISTWQPGLESSDS